MTTFNEALALAKSELSAGNILQIQTGYCQTYGKYITVESDQGWNPVNFWQELEDDYYPMFDL